MCLYGVAQCTGSLAVDDADRRNMCKVGHHLNIYPKERSLVGGLADQVDLCGDGCGLAHFDFAGTGTAVFFAGRRSFFL